MFNFFYCGSSVPVLVLLLMSFQLSRSWAFRLCQVLQSPLRWWLPGGSPPWTASTSPWVARSWSCWHIWRSGTQNPHWCVGQRCIHICVWSTECRICLRVGEARISFCYLFLCCLSRCASAVPSVDRRKFQSRWNRRRGFLFLGSRGWREPRSRWIWKPARLNVRKFASFRRWVLRRWSPFGLTARWNPSTPLRHQIQCFHFELDLPECWIILQPSLMWYYSLAAVGSSEPELSQFHRLSFLLARSSSREKYPNPIGFAFNWPSLAYDLCPCGYSCWRRLTNSCSLRFEQN